MKVWNYMAIMLGMMVFLYFLGFHPAGTDDILGKAGIEINSTTGELVKGDVSNSDWSSLFLSLIAGIGTAVVVGFFTKTFDFKIAMIGFFTAIVVQFASFGWAIINLAKDTGESWLVGVVATIFIPITVMFIFSIVEWFGGVD